MVSSVRIAVLLAQVLLVATCLQAYAYEALQGKAGTQATTVFDPTLNTCELGYDVPDAPARAFRDSSGTIHLFSTNHHNRALIGKSFDTMNHPCSLVFKADEKPVASNYDDYGWLASFYMLNDSAIYALVHNEFHAFERSSDCPTRDAVNCIEYSITSAISGDGGNTFHRSVSDALVASLPVRFDGRSGKLSGYSNPSNIVAFRGYYYVLFASLDPLHFSSGVCLMRAATLRDSSSWRAWDGVGFNIQFRSPYAEEEAASTEAPCKPVSSRNLFYSIGSVGHISKLGLFVAVMRLNNWDANKGQRKAGIYLTSSSDLITWSTPTALILDTDAYVGGQTELLYPSLIDPLASDCNFLEITDSPLLFTVDAELGGSFDSHKLVYRKIQIVSP